MPLCLPLAIDSNDNWNFHNGQRGSRDIIRSAEKLHSNNVTSCDSVQTLIVDKDMASINVFKKVFPKAQIQLCLFHCLQIFRREVTETKLNISSALKITILEILTELIYSQTPEEYNKNYEMLKKSNVFNLSSISTKIGIPLRSNG